MNDTLDSTRRMAADALERASSRMKDLRSGMSDRASAAQRYVGDYASVGKSYVTDHPLKSALDPHDGGRMPGQVQELLMGIRMLHDELGPSVHRRHLGTPGFAETLHVLPCVSLEVGERVDVVQVDHTAFRVHEISCQP